MQLNTASPTRRTHEGARVSAVSPHEEMRRAVMSCLLWEDNFYESGSSVAQRIQRLAELAPNEELASLALEARRTMHLRHVPLLLLIELSKRRLGKFTSDTIAAVISRPDEITELVAMWWKLTGRRNLPKSMRNGLAAAFEKFDEYQFAKYDRLTAVKFRDVLRLVHPKSPNSALLGRIITGELARPNTWESRLAAGEDKKTVFTELIVEGKLGYMALLRNLEGMTKAGVDENLICQAILARRGADNVLPFRYITALLHAPQFYNELDLAMQAAVKDLPEFSGTTLVLVDTSGSMIEPISRKSRILRCDVAAALAALVNGRVRLFSFANGIEELPALRGLGATRIIHDAIGRVGHGTMIGAAYNAASMLRHDRCIIITDGQSFDPLGAPSAPHNYIINVASYENGVGYGPWTTINGWSDNIFRFLAEMEHSE